MGDRYMGVYEALLPSLYMFYICFKHGDGMEGFNSSQIIMGKYRSKSSEREGLCFHLAKGAEGLGKPLTFQARVGGSHTGRYQPRGRRPGDTPWPRAYKGDAGSARV